MVAEAVDVEDEEDADGEIWPRAEVAEAGSTGLLTGLSRSPGCLCRSDEQQFKSNTRPSLHLFLLRNKRATSNKPSRTESWEAQEARRRRLKQVFPPRALYPCSESPL